MERETYNVENLAESLYLQGYDISPELLGKKIKSIGKRIVSAVKKIKKSGGVSISTPKGSAQFGTPAAPLETIPENTLQEKLKKPETIAMLAGAAIVIYMLTKKKKGGRK